MTAKPSSRPHLTCISTPKEPAPAAASVPSAGTAMRQPVVDDAEGVPPDCIEPGCTEPVLADHPKLRPRCERHARELVERESGRIAREACAFLVSVPHPWLARYRGFPEGWERFVADSGGSYPTPEAAREAWASGVENLEFYEALGVPCACTKGREADITIQNLAVVVDAAGEPSIARSRPYCGRQGACSDYATNGRQPRRRARGTR